MADMLTVPNRSGPVIRIVREKERLAITGISRTTAFILERKGLFPRRVKLSGNRVGWKLAELEEWVSTRPAVKPGGES